MIRLLACAVCCCTFTLHAAEPFQEADGLVVIEAESGTVNPRQVSTDIADYTGTGTSTTASLVARVRVAER